MDIYTELEKERKILDHMAEERIKEGLPLTDAEIFEQKRKFDLLLNEILEILKKEK